MRQPIHDYSLLYTRVKKPLMLVSGKTLSHNAHNLMSELHRPKIAILASGGGTTAEAYAQAIHSGQVDHEIGLVIASSPEAGILERVERWNNEWGFDVETAVVNNTTHPGKPQGRGQTYEASEAITKLADQTGVDLIATLGYMTIIKSPLLEAYCYLPDEHRSIYEASAVNTHPGPLPLTQDTMGREASEKVLATVAFAEIGNLARRYLDREEIETLKTSEHTMHVISPVIDDPQAVFARHPVEILPEDTPETLFQRVQWIEKATIAYALDKFLRDQEVYLP